VSGPASVAEAPAPHLRGEVAAAPEAHQEPSHIEPAANPAADRDVALGSILDYADRHSPLLAVARSTRSRAEAARVAASLLLPTNPELTIAMGPRMGPAGRGLDVDATLMQQVQIAGERSVRKEVAARLREVTDAEIEQMRWAVHCDVHAGFHRALLEQERLRLAGRVVVFQESVLGVVERQIAAGETAPLTLRLAQAEVAQARQVLVGAEQAFLASRLRLAQLAGWPITTPPKPAGAFDSPREPAPLTELAAIARQKLPSVRAAAARIREAKARVTLADREAWPRPAIGVQYRREGNPGSEGVYDVLMGVLSLPLPVAQLNQGERARTRADLTVVEAELAASRLLLDGQIAEARSEVVAAAARTKAYGTEILPRFEENLTLLRRSFELGEIDILALSTGRERFLRIQSDALLAQQDYFVALAGLERVVGVDLWHDDHH
ncbi:MAG TPA: TolC family protein, partial [Polyangiaceae bacterium]|nr:TolC family protein [Polyangiaceae bacterium]